LSIVRFIPVQLLFVRAPKVEKGGITMEDMSSDSRRARKYARR
jgi:hypothetical protein